MRITRTVCDHCKDENSAKHFEVDINRSNSDDDNYRYYSGDLCHECGADIQRELKNLTSKYNLGV